MRIYRFRSWRLNVILRGSSTLYHEVNVKLE